MLLYTETSVCAQGASPINGEQVRRDATLNFAIEDFITAVNPSTVKLFFDGADVTSSAMISKPANITTVAYDPQGLMAIGSWHMYSLIYSDNGTPVTHSAWFTVHIYPTSGSFLIEAEDFNFGGGQHQAVADTMPYFGGAYTNLTAVLGVDYNDSDARDSQPYRGGFAAGQNVGHDTNATPETLDTDRGEWSVTANYKIGWVGSPNEWYNYTRTIPANSYQIWAALSHGDENGSISARMEQVTNDPTQPNQTVAVLGTFSSPRWTGGWGNNVLLPLKDTGGNVVEVNLNGVETLRFNPIEGDYDYLMLVPAPPPRLNMPVVSGANVMISWTGTGILQQATVLTGAPADWSDVNPQPTGNSFTVTPGAATPKFYRLKR